MRYLHILAFIILFTFQSYAQNNNTFSNNTEEFLPKMEELFESATDKKYTKSYLIKLTKFWHSQYLDEDKKLHIINNCNALANKKARPQPDFETYLNTVMDYLMADISKSSLDAWDNALTNLIKQKRIPLRKINSFLQTTHNLLLHNTIYLTPSNHWKANNNQWELTYKEKDLIATFPNLKLTCFSKNDSIQIFNTSGTFNYTTNIWKGDKGRITWERSGFSADSVYAVFDKYTVPFKDAEVKIDTVRFYNTIYFDHVLYGNLRHKVMNINSPEGAKYPQFTSTEQRFKLDNIHPNLNYEGGFAQNGAKFLGAGTYKNPAKITIYRNDTLFLTAKSLHFSLRKNQIMSNDTEIRFQLDTGFVYHPGLIFKFIVDKNELHLIRNGEGLAISPYFNTFHNVSMDIELLSWNLDKTVMHLKMVSGAAENLGAFESLSYFRENFYNQLQGMDAIHPLQGLKKCSRYYKGKSFTASDYARMMGFPENQIRQQIIKLSFYGFIGYNVNTDEIKIRQRLNDYLLFRLKKKDYDVIRFTSHTSGSVPNAQIDLKNYDLNINGVKSIAISDNQNVVFFPRNEKILLKRNRNFTFDGVINAGMLNLYGDGFKFSYDDFLIDMKNIDSVRMKVQTGELDYFGNPKLTYVRNTIEKLSGQLQIDKPTNKSGAKYYSEYPILNSSTETFVYFDMPEIQNGQYKRDKFYFKLQPFTLDSISKLTRKNFDFAGTFVSNIFPTFDENLTVQKDFSLGFTLSSPEEGYNIYDKRAKFINNIDLSNKGLRGNGTLQYITSTSKSENFLFLPQETSGQTYDFLVDKREEGTEYPDVKGKYNHISYLPYQDKLISTSQEEAFSLFNNETQLSGSITISKFGAKGKGTFYMDNANLISPNMTFGGHTVLADSSNFNLVGKTVQDISFNTTNLISNIDFETRQGTFVSQAGGSMVNFTDNRYVSYINEFSWNMDLNYIYLGASGSEGNRFISTHRRQDSLEFRVPLARYDVENKVIYAQEVKNIKVADVNMILNNGLVTIREDADMAPLDSVLIVLKDSTHNHTIKNSHIKIEGKYDYSGYGEYDYVNGNGKTYTIQFNDIGLNDDLRTFAKGNIPESDLFTFDKHFTFKGKTELNATEKHLTFDGGVQMLHQCSGGPQMYTYFNAKIDPENILIPIGEEPVNFERKNIHRDFYLTKDSAHIYSTFLQHHKDYSDIPIISANGYLHFNEKNNAYEIASLAKINNPDTTGVLFQYSNTTCNVLAEGNLNLAIDLDQLKLKAAGSIIDDRRNNKISLSTLLGIDFFFNDIATNQMVAAILSSKATESKLSDITFQKRMAEWVDIKDAAHITQKKKAQGQIPELKKLIDQMFIFGNIDFRFDGKSHAYIADGKADLNLIRDFNINKKVDVKAEIVKKRSGNSLDMFLQFDDETWFYFSYKSGMMQTLSSDASYNTTIQTLNTEERKMKTSFGEKSFTFILSPITKLNRFTKRFGLEPIKASKKAAGQIVTEKDNKPEEIPTE
jgi:hypothetical protein